MLTLYKPIYPNSLYFGIRQETLRKAIRNRDYLKVQYQGIIYQVRPKQWIKTGTRIEKVYRFPDNPMILYCNYLNSFPKEQSMVEQWMNE